MATHLQISSNLQGTANKKDVEALPKVLVI